MRRDTGIGGRDGAGIGGRDGAGSGQRFNLPRALLFAADARDAEEIAVGAAAGFIIMAAMEGDFESASQAATLFAGQRGTEEGGAVVRARLYAEALRDPSAGIDRLVAAAAPSGLDAEKIRALALVTSLRRAADHGKLSRAEARFSELWDMEDDGSFADLSYVKARGACMLMELYGERLMFDGLQGIFKTADVLENRHDVAVEKFRASVRIIASYAAGGELEPALSLYRPLAYLEGLGEFTRMRAAAAAALSAAFAERGIVAEARALYAVQAELWEASSSGCPQELLKSPDPLGIVAAAADPLRCHEREAFRFEEEAGLEEGMWVDRARAAASLMDGYAAGGEAAEALAVYAELNVPEPALLPPALRLAVTKGIFEASLKIGNLECAKEAILGDGMDLPPLDALQEGRAALAGSLMTALAIRGDLDGARSVYDALEFPGTGPKAGHARAYVSGKMASLLAQGGQPAKAARLLGSESFIEDLRDHPLIAAKCSLELAESFVRKGCLDKARAICESGSLELGVADAASGKAMATSSAIARLCLDGDLDAARRLFEELPDSRRSRKSALYRFMASMSLMDAYRETGNTEGLEFIRRCVEGFGTLEANLYNNRAGSPEDDGTDGW
jgi:hypothetical protein